MKNTDNNKYIYKKETNIIKNIIKINKYIYKTIIKKEN